MATVPIVLPPLPLPPMGFPNLGIDWLVHRPGADPYLVWAGISQFTGFDLPASTAQQLAQIVVETADATPPWSVGPTGVGLGPHLICQTENKLGRIWSGDIAAPTLLALLTGTVGPPVAIELNLPRIRHLDILPRFVPIPVNVSARMARSVVAVIDHGCPFAHRQFMERIPHRSGNPASDTWRTRVTALWDQNVDHTVDRPVKVPIDGGRTITTWRPVGPFGYGREMTATELGDLVDACTQAAVVDEDAVYALADYQTMGARRTHGCHVMDMAAGALNPMTQARDAASDADIIFVELPRGTVADTSGGSMTKYVLDALRYVLDKTATNVDHLVVNLSFGATAGAHDGSSLLERGIDLLIEQARLEARGRKLEVVIAAGNHILKNGHARVRLDAAQPRQTLGWNIMPDDRTDNFLELWYPRGIGQELRVTLRSPSGRIVAPSEFATHVAVTDPAGALVGALLHSDRPSGAVRQAQVLIALRPTHVDARLTTPLGQQQAPAEHGLWQVELHSVGVQPLLLDAWVQRDDPLPWQGGQPQSELLSNRPDRSDDDDDLATDLVRRRTTASSVATGHNTVIVGAYVRAERELSRYTAAGPSLNTAREAARTWPDCVAPADESGGLPGILAAGARSGVLVRMNGTSVAAPQVARALMNCWIQGVPPPIPVAPGNGPPPLGDLRDFRVGGCWLDYGP